jgi:hypothetical protein
MNLDPTTTGRVLGGTLKTERHSLDRYNGTGPRRYGGEVQARHAWPIRIKGENDGGHTGLWDAVVLEHRGYVNNGYVNGTTLWEEGERVWATPLAGVSLSAGQESLGTLVEFGGVGDDRRLILSVGAGGGGGWEFYELYDAQTVIEALDPGQVNSDLQAYKMVKRKMVGSGRWEDDGSPFAEFCAFAGEPFEGFAGRFRTRLDAGTEPSGRGLLVQARPSPTESGKWEFTPVATGFDVWRVDVVHPLPRSGGVPVGTDPTYYECVLIEFVPDADAGAAGNQRRWVDVSPEVRLLKCVRTPMKLAEESATSAIRLPLEVGTGVTIRPSPTHRDWHEIVAAHSVQKWTRDFPVAIASCCTEPGVYPPNIITKTAWETLTVLAADLTVFIQPAGTGGAGERNNVTGQFMPPYEQPGVP